MSRPQDRLRGSFFTKVASSLYFSRVITMLIIINAIILGMETYPELMSSYGPILKTIDRTILWIFVVELCVRSLAYGKVFFRDPWSMFDIFVISVAFLPTHEVLAVLRVARVLRIVRLISIFPRLRHVVEGLVRSIPGIASIGSILGIMIYVFGVMATQLYGTHYPEWFGSLHKAIFSLFQIMTLEGWPDIVRPVMEKYAYSWVFFVSYILIATFSVLNLFIAVIVDAMQRQHAPIDQKELDTLTSIKMELAKLNKKIETLKK